MQPPTRPPRRKSPHRSGSPTGGLKSLAVLTAAEPHRPINPRRGIHGKQSICSLLKNLLVVIDKSWKTKGMEKSHVLLVCVGVCLCLLPKYFMSHLKDFNETLKKISFALYYLLESIDFKISTSANTSPSIYPHSTWHFAVFYSVFFPVWFWLYFLSRVSMSILFSTLFCCCSQSASQIAMLHKRL